MKSPKVNNIELTSFFQRRSIFNSTPFNQFSKAGFVLTHWQYSLEDNFCILKIIFLDTINYEVNSLVPRTLLDDQVLVH